jgi:hypothetical protein
MALLRKYNVRHSERSEARTKSKNPPNYDVVRKKLRGILQSLEAPSE